MDCKNCGKQTKLPELCRGCGAEKTKLRKRFLSKEFGSYRATYGIRKFDVDRFSLMGLMNEIRKAKKFDGAHLFDGLAKERFLLHCKKEERRVGPSLEAKEKTYV